MSIETHTKDARIVVTDDLNRFIDVARNNRYEGVILKRTDAQKALIQSHLIKTWKAALQHNPSSSDVYISCPVDQDKNIHPEYPKGFDNDVICTEVQTIGDTFQKITECGDTNIFLYTRFNLRTHDHNFDVLNCAWNGSGTAWFNPEGEELSTNAGDWFFFREGFEHHSPPLTQNHRFIFIARPTPQI